MTKAAAGASRRVVRDVGRALAGCVIWLLIGSAWPRQAAGQGWFIALQGSSSSIRRDVHPGIWAVCEWRVIRPEVRRRSTKCTSRRLHVQVNLADLHLGVADVLSLALIVSYMGCVKTRAAPTRIEIEAVSTD